MGKWVPLKSDVLDAVAADILHNYGRGRVRIGVDGVFGAGQSRFADELADALRSTGRTVVRGGVDSFESILPDLASDVILIVDGTGLLRPALAGQWHYTLWLDAGVAPDPVSARYLAEVRPRAAATGIIDVSDPDAPRRVFADSC